MDPYNCHFCGEKIDPKDPGVFRRVTGWVENKKASSPALLQSPATGYACRICVDIKRSKIGQRESLF
jgi:hypothetical protein